MPFHFVRLSGECLNIVLKLSSVIISHSFVARFSISGMGENEVSVCGLLKRFQGQTSWQVSQPKSQLSNFPFISPGISISFSSMVKYEMHLLPSITFSGRIASVGHASIQRVQVPQ